MPTPHFKKEDVFKIKELYIIIVYWQKKSPWPQVFFLLLHATPQLFLRSEGGWPAFHKLHVEILIMPLITNNDFHDVVKVKLGSLMEIR